MKTRAVLDTGVIIEYIDNKGPFHEPALVLFDTIMEGKVEVHIPNPVLAEAFYVSYNLYRSLRMPKPAVRARLLVEWLYRLASHSNLDNGVNLALETSRTMQKYKLALTDCYVLALSKIAGARPIFRRREQEMLKHLKDLEREYRPLFLEDYTDNEPTGSR